MREQDVVAIVQRERDNLDIDPHMEIATVEKAIVEYTPDRSRPGVVEDRIAWIVDLASSQGLARVHVDDRTGQVLEVLR